jgi:hypothetical protein
MGRASSPTERPRPSLATPQCPAPVPDAEPWGGRPKCPLLAFLPTPGGDLAVKKSCWIEGQPARGGSTGSSPKRVSYSRMTPWRRRDSRLAAKGLRMIRSAGRSHSVPVGPARDGLRFALDAIAVQCTPGRSHCQWLSPTARGALETARAWRDAGVAPFGHHPGSSRIHCGSALDQDIVTGSPVEDVNPRSTE